MVPWRAGLGNCSLDQLLLPGSDTGAATVRILGGIPQVSTDIPMGIARVVLPRQDLQCCEIHSEIPGGERMLQECRMEPLILI